MRQIYFSGRIGILFLKCSVSHLSRREVRISVYVGGILVQNFEKEEKTKTNVLLFQGERELGVF